MESTLRLADWIQLATRPKLHTTIRKVDWKSPLLQCDDIYVTQGGQTLHIVPMADIANGPQHSLWLSQGWLLSTVLWDASGDQREMVHELKLVCHCCPAIESVWDSLKLLLRQSYQSFI